MEFDNTKLIVTAALPYANGPLHLGHMVEYIQPDIWVRTQRMLNKKCFFVCGSDAHGTPIMLKAQNNNTTPEQIVAEYQRSHASVLQSFQVELDNFYTTHSEDNLNLVLEIYEKLKNNDDLETVEITQFYDEEKQMFLPDRMVKGNCPKCNASDQYGDNCDQCGATYNSMELKNPRSTLSGNTPVQKKSKHLFFKLTKYKDFLLEWLEHADINPEIVKKLHEWFEAGLQDWDISRDSPYFGFEIPDMDQQYFYVWLDAPVGYIASFKNLCKRIKEDYREYWQEDNTAVKLHHFIGKDITYFHCLFWPAILKASNFKLPDSVKVHGFLTINGTKMSKSKGTFLTAEDYLNYLPADYLRYYYAAKLTASAEDIDLNWEDFSRRINSDLVGKLVNIASRSCAIISKKFNNHLSTRVFSTIVYNNFTQKKDEIINYYLEREYAKAIKAIMSLADEANRLIDKHKPWLLIKQPETLNEAHEICSFAINLFRVLITYLKPILPELSIKVENLLNIKLTFEGLNDPLKNHLINTFSPLINRVDEKQIENMMIQSLKLNTPEYKDSSIEQEQNNIHEGETSMTEQTSNFISIEDFAKVELIVAKIVSAEAVPEARKLIKLVLDIGKTTTKQVFAGIKSAYNPEELVGKHTVMVANLAPRKMKFGISEGMVLAASGESKSGIWLISPDDGAEPGMSVK